MKPVIKYQGGKSKELPIIKEMLPKGFNRVVEPFCGGAAVSFALGYPALLSDINKDVINLYHTIADPSVYLSLQRNVDEIKGYDHDKLQEEYYKARDVINTDASSFTRALSYIILRQLCFSGMERYNAKGEFNVPFGHYKRFSCNLSLDHHQFLKKCDIRHGSFSDLFDDITSSDFLFIDPPYLERLGYTEGDGGESLHKELAQCLKSTTAKWMIVHSDHKFYRETYKDFNIVDRDFSYSQRFGKDINKSEAPKIDTFVEIDSSSENVVPEKKKKPLKDHSGAKVKHLYVTNY